MIVCHDHLHLSFLTNYLKKRKRKPKKQSRMDNPDTQQIFGTRQRTKTEQNHHLQKTKKISIHREH